MDSNEALEGRFNAAEAPQHRIHVIGMAEALLANNPAVRQGLAEMSMQTQKVEQEFTDNVSHVDFRNRKIVSLSEKNDLEQDALAKIDAMYDGGNHAQAV